MIHIPSHLQDAEAELLTAWKRIAELEAERDIVQSACNDISDQLRDRTIELKASAARIAELEAERELTTPPMWRKAYDEQKIEIARLTAENVRIAELEAALRPFTKLRKVEQFKTAVLVEDDLITVVVRVGDIKAALAALSGEGVTE